MSKRVTIAFLTERAERAEAERDRYLAALQRLDRDVRRTLESPTELGPFVDMQGTTTTWPGQFTYTAWTAWNERPA